MKKTNTILSICFALVLASCGGAGGASKSVNVTMVDFQFTPNTFTVPAGEQISFRAVNNGSVEHSFVIMKLGYEVTSQFSEADQANVYWEKTAIPAGQTANDTFTAPSEPGEYQIVCHVPGHIEAGMVGKLIVVTGQ